MDGTMAYEAGFGRVPHRAYGYSGYGGGFRRTDQDLTSSVLGDGGIYSSVDDLFKWDQALYTNKLVSAKMLELAFRASISTGKPGRGYGHGWYVDSYRGIKEG